MKKIKRFVVNVLSPEEMRQINVGRSNGCSTSRCFAYIYVNKELKGTYSGSCGADASIKQCVCKTSAGNFYDSNYECGKWRD